MKSGTLPNLKIFDNQAAGFAANEIDSFRAIVLETSENCLLGGSPDPRKIIYFGDTILVADKQTQSILAFSNNGSFLYSIGKQGDGPEEFLEFSSVFYDNGLVYIPDDSSRHLLCYDKDGKFLWKRVMNVWMCPDKISRIGDAFFFYNAGYFVPNPYKISIKDTMMQMKGGIFPYEYSLPNCCESFAKCLNGNILFAPSYNDTVFEISEKCIHPKLTLGYYKQSEREILDYYCTLGINEFYDVANSKDDSNLMFVSVNESPNHFIIQFNVNPWDSFLCIYSKMSKESRTYQIHDETNGFDNLPFVKFQVFDDWLITFGTDVEWIQRVNSGNLFRSLPEDVKAKMKSYNSESNPMILSFHLKNAL